MRTAPVWRRCRAAEPHALSTACNTLFATMTITVHITLLLFLFLFILPFVFLCSLSFISIPHPPPAPPSPAAALPRAVTRGHGGSSHPAPWRLHAHTGCGVVAARAPAAARRFTCCNGAQFSGAYPGARTRLAPARSLNVHKACCCTSSSSSFSSSSSSSSSCS